MLRFFAIIYNDPGGQHVVVATRPCAYLFVTLRQATFLSCLSSTTSNVRRRFSERVLLSHWNRQLASQLSQR